MSTILSTEYREYRCLCGKLLCKGFIRDGEIEIKCKRCGVLNLIKAGTPDTDADTGEDKQADMKGEKTRSV